MKTMCAIPNVAPKILHAALLHALFSSKGLHGDNLQGDFRHSIKDERPLSTDLLTCPILLMNKKLCLCHHKFWSPFVITISLPN